MQRGREGWRLVTNGGVVDAERVVVATGHSNVPYRPDWPGTFAGPDRAFGRVPKPAPYAGQRVLVVGAGNWGAETAVDLADGGAAEVFLSVRTPPNIVRRDTLGFPSQVLGMPHRVCRLRRSTESPARCAVCRFLTSRPTGYRLRCGRTRTSSAAA